MEKKETPILRIIRENILLNRTITTSILIIFLCSAFADLRACLNHFHQLIFLKRQKPHPSLFYSLGTSFICRTSIILHGLTAAQQGNHPATPRSFTQLGSIHPDAAASAGVPRGQAGLQSFQQGNLRGRGGVSSVCCAPLTDPAPSSPVCAQLSPSWSTAPTPFCTRAVCCMYGLTTPL